MAETTRHVIETRDEYLDAVEKIKSGNGPIAIDAERASGFRYSQRAYLIQIFRRGAGVFLFDPPAIGDFAELQEAIADVEWVLHAASQDIACLREVGLDPQTIFDTELCARLLGFARVGLGTVVEQQLGIHLAKEHSAADWSTRPLPASWLEYAALDVELLVDLRDSLDVLLTEQGKQEIAKQEFAAVLSKEAKAVAAEPWRRLSGIHGIRNARSLAVARELWLTRDAYAQEIDTAPGRLVPDSSLLAVVKNVPSSRKALSDMRDFTGRASRSEIARWWEAVERGLASTDLPAVRVNGDTLPPPRIWSERNPEADARLKLARAAISEVSEHMDIPLENLLTPDYLRRVAWRPPSTIDADAISEALRELGARPWQIEACAQKISAAFVEAHQSLLETADSPS